MTNTTDRDRFTSESRLRYHRTADTPVMNNINKREKSPETRKLLERRIRRIQYWNQAACATDGHKKLQREILLLRRRDPCGLEEN